MRFLMFFFVLFVHIFFFVWIIFLHDVHFAKDILHVFL